MSKSLGMTPATCVKLSSLLVLSMLFATTVAAAPTKGVAVLENMALRRRSRFRRAENRTPA